MKLIKGKLVVSRKMLEKVVLIVIETMYVKFFFVFFIWTEKTLDDFFYCHLLNLMKTICGFAFCFKLLLEIFPKKACCHVSVYQIVQLAGS